MENSGDQPQAPRVAAAPSGGARLVLAIACLLIAGLYVALADLKGIGTDEGFRLGIINGGQEFTAAEPATQATWGDVLRANNPYAYQPLYFLIQNTVMHLGRTHDEFVLKCVNVFFLWLTLQGLLALSREWALVPRLFVLGLFSLNAYLFMHVLQLREYIVGIAFYVWSTWLVLQLDRRTFRGGWTDAGWFAVYGGLLGLGFYTQSWVVFPACAQGLFLVLRPAGDRLRFYAHLALSYVVVLALAWPYLQTHRQKVDIGRWGMADTALWPNLANGFHYVLSGHAYNKSLAANLLCAFWVVFLGAGAALLFGRKNRAVAPVSGASSRQQWFLMLLCLGLSVAFQIAYFVKVDTLSVWPRYFALHYFFVLWLVALSFQRCHEFATAGTLPAAMRRRWRAATVAALAVVAVSGGFQIRSYYRDPYLDSGLSRENNWRIIGTSLARVTRPGDVVLTQDFLHAWTLTFTQPLPNRVVSVPELGAGPVDKVQRFVYLESNGNLPARAALATRLAGLGFGAVHEEPLPGDPTVEPLPWRAVVFERP